MLCSIGWEDDVGALTSFALAALFFFAEPLLVNIRPALAVAKYLALINGMLGTVQPDSRISVRWWASFSSHRLRSLEKLSTGYVHRCQHRTILWISFYHYGRIAGTERERWQWIVDGIHRLVPRKRSRSPNPAANDTRSIS
jgi:hypothetical protein